MKYSIRKSSIAFSRYLNLCTKLWYPEIASTHNHTFIGIIKMRKWIRIVKITDLTFLDFVFIFRHPRHVSHILNGQRMRFRTCRWDDNVVRILFSDTFSRTASHCTYLWQVGLYVLYWNNVYRSICTREIPSQCLVQWASYQIRKIAGCICAGNAGTFSPAADFKGNR